MHSGCRVNEVGNVACGPDALRAQAEGMLRQAGVWAGRRSLPRPTYTLARYMASEVGNGTPEEKVAVGQAADHLQVA